MTAAAAGPPDLRSLVRRSRRRLTERDFWLVQLGVAAVTVIHALIEASDPEHGLSGLFQAIHHIPVIAYLVPLAYAGLRYGVEGGLLTGLLVTLLSIPNMALIHRGGFAWLGEAMAVGFVAAIGIVLSFVVENERRAGREVEAQARRLSMLRRVSLAIGESKGGVDLVGTVLDELVDGTDIRNARFTWTDTDLPQVVRRPGPRSAESDGEGISVDVSVENHRYGTIHVDPPPDETDFDYRALLEGVAAELALALDNARLTAQERDRRRAYLRGVTEAQETERRRVARELHDNAQSLVLLSRMLAEVNDDPEVPASIGERVEALQELARGMLEEMRRTSRDLRPPVLDDLGLLAALEWVVGRHASFGGLDVAFVVEGPPRRLDPQTELAAFRIAQEALANAEKHADAEEVEVRARFDELGLLLEISDDGRGFDVSTPPSGFGLTGMRERARLVDASFSVTSGPDGTVVRFRSGPARDADGR